jgi:hypothetical protein
MGRRFNPQSFAVYDFGWSASGTNTFRHNCNFPARHTEYPYEVRITEGDAYVSTKGPNTFAIVATSAAGYCTMEPWIDPNDGPETA